MSATLLKHLWRTQPERMAYGSFMDCHVKGLHSVMLINRRGAIVRMFVTTPDHEMHRNFPGGDLSIAFHNHDADLTLHVLTGRIANIGIMDTPGYEFEEHDTFEEYAYESQIRDGAGGFTPTGNARELLTTINWLDSGESVFMPAREYHSVAVDRGEVAAWFVYEGIKDLTYKPLVYSNSDLSKFDPSGMYRRPSVEELGELLRPLL